MASNSHYYYDLFFRWMFFCLQKANNYKEILDSAKSVTSKMISEMHREWSGEIDRKLNTVTALQTKLAQQIVDCEQATKNANDVVKSYHSLIQHMKSKQVLTVYNENLQLRNNELIEALTEDNSNSSLRVSLPFDTFLVGISTSAKTHWSGR